MRTVRHLFPRLCDLEHLELAAAATVRGKRRRRDVSWFLFTLDQQLAELREELVTGRYRPAGFDLVSIRDPKPRLIARVPIRDRVLHTAVVQLIEPVFSPSYSPDAYACRRAYGAHRAVLSLQEFLRRYRYALHLDIKNYFPSLDVDILRDLLGRRIRDDRFLQVVDQLLESGRGLYGDTRARRLAGLDTAWPPPGRGIPIGSYTSQLFAAHIYLNDFDHFVKRELRIPAYCRYVDDLFVFGNRKSEIDVWRERIIDWLATERGLRLKHPRAGIVACRTHLDALGYRIDREGLQSRPRTLSRLSRRACRHIEGTATVDFDRSLASSSGLILF